MNDLNIDGIAVKNAVSYERVSTSKQVDGESLEHQRRGNNTFAENIRYRMVKFFTEKGESTGTLNRPALQEMIKFCCNKENKISAIIVWRIDRLSRDLNDLLNLAAMFAKLNIQILSATENNAISPEGKLIRNVVGSTAQYERDINRIRTRASNEECIRKGRWIRKLRGYTFNENIHGKKQLFPNEEAPFIKEIFELKNKAIYTDSEIRKKMKSRGFNILPQALFKTLRNPVYAGLLPDKQGTINNGQYIKGIHEPIISEKLFYSVQAIVNRKRPTATPRHKNNPEFPLRGFIICSVCGKPLSGSISHGKKIKVPYYQCRTKGCPRYQKKTLEPAYIDYLKSIQASPTVMKAFEKIVFDRFNERTAEINKNNERLNKIISDLEDEKTKTISLIARGFITEEEGRFALDKIKTKIEEHKGYFEIEDETTPKLEEYWDFSKFFMGNVSDLWINGDLNLKQRITGLTTPSGFFFKDNFVEPLKTPYFTSIFVAKNTMFKFERAQEELNL